MKVILKDWYTGELVVGILEGCYVDNDGYLVYWVRELGGMETLYAVHNHRSNDR